MDLDTRLDPQKLLDFHDVMLNHVQDDERVYRAWEESNSADQRRWREEHREAWLDYHCHMRELHSAPAEEARGAQKSPRGGGGSR